MNFRRLVESLKIISVQSQRGPHKHPPPPPPRPNRVDGSVLKAITFHPPYLHINFFFSSKLANYYYYY